MDQFINYYDILAISRDATKEEIDKKFKQCKRVWGQEQNSPDVDTRRKAEDYLRELPTIMDILLDESKRQDYNKKLKEIEEYERKRKQSPSNDAQITTGNELILKGAELLNSKRLKEALAIATQASEKFGDNPESWYLLAKVQFANGDTEDAIYAFKKAISKRDSFGLYHFELGKVYQSISKNTDAFSEFKKAINCDRNNIEYHIYLGRTYYNLSMYDDAENTLLNCYKSNSNNEKVKQFLSEVYQVQCTRNWTSLEGLDRDLQKGEIVRGDRSLFPTEIYHIDEALKYADRLESINADFAQEVRKQVEIIKQRSFGGSHQLGIGAGLFWGLISMVMFSPQGIGFLLIPLYYLAARPRKYQIYKRIATGNSPNLLAKYQQAQGLGKILVLVTFPFFILSDFIDNYLLDGKEQSIPNPIRILINSLIKINSRIILVVVGIILAMSMKIIPNPFDHDSVTNRWSKIDDELSKCIQQFAGQIERKALSCYQQSSQKWDAELTNIDRQLSVQLKNPKDKSNFVTQEESWKQLKTKALDNLEDRISKNPDKELILLKQQISMTKQHLEVTRNRANNLNFKIK